MSSSHFAASPFQDHPPEAHNSADEITPIVDAEQGTGRSYNTTEPHAQSPRLSYRVDDEADETDRQARSPSGLRERQQSESKGKKRQTDEGEDEGKAHPSQWSKLVDKFGSVELENKGSVARDHLALGISSVQHPPSSIGHFIASLLRSDTADRVGRTDLFGLASYLPCLCLHWNRRHAVVPPQYDHL